MNADASPAFIDTNVLVYCLEHTASQKQDVAKELLDRLMKQNRIRLSTYVLQELFATLTRKVKHGLTPEEAVDCLDDLAKWPILAADYDIVRRAAVLSSEASLSFWDALIVVSAFRSGAKTLYTEDLSHGQEILGVRVVNPFHGLNV